MMNKLMSMVLVSFFICANNVMSAEVNTTEKVFTQVYDSDVWFSKGTSGLGSRVENTKQYMDFLQAFLKNNNVKSVVDVGCGDWSFSKYIDWSGAFYSGYDIVKSVIEENKKLYSHPNRLFVHGDALTSDLPQADLLICKDVLQHLPHVDIFTFLKQLSKFKYCLIMNDVDFDTETSLNNDVVKGDYRSLDLTKKPFDIKGAKVLTYVAHHFVKKQLLLIIN